LVLVAPRKVTAERILARIAGRAEGIVTRKEALAGGLSDNEIRHRRRIGLLIAEFPGV
jgi:hypothetical protein